MLLCQADGRPAHLTRVHAALLALADADQRRLGVVTEWRAGPHTLTYRQVERTFGLIEGLFSPDAPTGEPTSALDAAVDGLMEASIPADYKQASTSLAVDWTDHETWALAPHRDEVGADPDAEIGRAHV